MPVNPNEDLVHQNADYIVRKEMSGDPRCVQDAAEQLRKCALSMDAAHDPQSFQHLLNEIREREQRYGSASHVETNMLRNGYEDVSIVTRDQYGRAYNGVEVTRIPLGLGTGGYEPYRGNCPNDVPPAPVPSSGPYYPGGPTVYQPPQPGYSPQYGPPQPGYSPQYYPPVASGPCFPGGGGYGYGYGRPSVGIGVSVPIGHSGVRIGFGTRLPID